MTKEKLESTETLVREILEVDEDARNSDNILYLRVLERIADKKQIHLYNFCVPYFFCNMKEYGFPPFETVRRSRQKIQRKFPELRANKEVADQREENEEVYREFAKT